MSMSNENLSTQKCIPRKGIENALSLDTIHQYLTMLNDWHYISETQQIRREFNFENFHETMAFVNALAWMAHQQDHHPDLQVGYNYCRIFYSTHDVGGISLNDFICAAKVDNLL